MGESQVNLSQQPELKQRQCLSFEKSQRLVGLIQQERQLSARIDQQAKDLRTDCKRLRVVRRDIRRMRPAHCTLLPWDKRPEFKFYWLTAGFLLVAFLAQGQHPLSIPVTNSPPAESIYTASWTAPFDVDRTGWRLTWSTTTNETNSIGAIMLSTTNRQYEVKLPTDRYWFFLRPLSQESNVNAITTSIRAGIVPTNFVNFDYHSNSLTNPPVRVYSVPSDGKGGFLESTAVRQFQQIP